MSGIGLHWRYKAHDTGKQDSCFKIITLVSKVRLMKMKQCIWMGIIAGLMTSCSVYSLGLPNALQPPGTYSAGKGAAGVRPSVLFPEGADFKIGLTDNVQLSGLACAQQSQVRDFEGGLLFNISGEHKPEGNNVTVIAFGGGANIGHHINTGTTTIGRDYTETDSISGPTYYIYEGWYPGFQINRLFGITLPLRIYELFGYYQYYQDITGSNPANVTSPLQIQGAAFVPEVDFCFDWVHINATLGFSVPLQFYESSTNPVIVYLLPNISAGVYYKW